MFTFSVNIDDLFVVDLTKPEAQIKTIPNSKIDYSLSDECLNLQVGEDGEEYSFSFCVGHSDDLMLGKQVCYFEYCYWEKDAIPFSNITDAQKFINGLPEHVNDIGSWFNDCSAGFIIDIDCVADAFVVRRGKQIKVKYIGYLVMDEAIELDFIDPAGDEEERYRCYVDDPLATRGEAVINNEDDYYPVIFKNKV